MRLIPFFQIVHTCTFLPPHWGTLYELALIPDKTLLARIEDGTIKPDIERKAAAGLKGRSGGRGMRGDGTSKGHSESSSNPSLALLTAWRAADQAARQEFFDALPLTDFFAAMSRELRAELQARVLGNAKRKHKTIKGKI